MIVFNARQRFTRHSRGQGRRILPGPVGVIEYSLGTAVILYIKT